LTDGPDAHDIAVAVIAVAKVCDQDPEALLRHWRRWLVIDLLHHGWPECSLAWRSRALGYKDKVHRPSKCQDETRERVREAWEALRAGVRPSEVGVSRPKSEAVSEAPRPSPGAVPLPARDATKARLREFLGTVWANTAGARPVDAE